MAAALDEQASETVTAGPAAPSAPAPAPTSPPPATRRGARAAAPARAARGPNARASKRVARRPPARASATTVANDDRPDSAPRNTPMRAAGHVDARPARQASRGGGRGSVQRRSRCAIPGAERARGPPPRPSTESPVASKLRHGAIALAPSASAARDDGQSAPSGVTAPTPRTNTGAAAPPLHPPCSAPAVTAPRSSRAARR